ncbi:DNA-binding transcriptional regulator BolA [Prorops nasuta]|uniref:DNA-binding transcriptional regulator BolA n=1 Tax=Prorops nasuta TaxID=863751 RepID=UPI0034CEE93D
MFRIAIKLKNNYNYLLYRKMSSSFTDNPVESSIRKKLEQSLQPKYVEVINESYMHNVPKGAETHFKVVVVSEQFVDQPLIKRHRIINELLNDELQSGVHALSIVAKTPKQWEESNKIITESPACRGGFGK